MTKGSEIVGRMVAPLMVIELTVQDGIDPQKPALTAAVTIPMAPNRGRMGKEIEAQAQRLAQAIFEAEVKEG